MFPLAPPETQPGCKSKPRHKGIKKQYYPDRSGLPQRARLREYTWSTLPEAPEVTNKCFSAYLKDSALLPINPRWSRFKSTESFIMIMKELLPAEEGAPDRKAIPANQLKQPHTWSSLRFWVKFAGLWISPRLGIHSPPSSVSALWQLSTLIKMLGITISKIEATSWYRTVSYKGL